jgi:hypothetical protein
VLFRRVLGSSVLCRRVLGSSVLCVRVLGSSVLCMRVLGSSVLLQGVFGGYVLFRRVLVCSGVVICDLLIRDRGNVPCERGWDCSYLIPFFLIKYSHVIRSFYFYIFFLVCHSLFFELNSHNFNTTGLRHSLDSI